MIQAKNLWFIVSHVLGWKLWARRRSSWKIMLHRHHLGCWIKYQATESFHRGAKSDRQLNKFRRIKNVASGTDVTSGIDVDWDWCYALPTWAAVATEIPGAVAVEAAPTEAAWVTGAAPAVGDAATTPAECAVVATAVEGTGTAPAFGAAEWGAGVGRVVETPTVWPVEAALVLVGTEAVPAVWIVEAAPAVGTPVPWTVEAAPVAGVVLATLLVLVTGTMPAALESWWFLLSPLSCHHSFKVRNWDRKTHSLDCCRSYRIS